MISLVMATYNGEEFLLDQLESIRNQTRQIDEVIICDDRSKDQTVKMIRDYIDKYQLSHWKLHQQEVNLGYCKNFIDGIKHSSGDIIFLCDQDDVWYPDKVKEMSEVMETNSDCYALSSRYYVIDQYGKQIGNPGLYHFKECDDGSLEELSVEDQIGCSCVRGFSVCFRNTLKDFLPSIKLDDLLAHDWFITIQAALFGKMYFLNRILTDYRFHSNNFSLSAINRKELVGDKDKRIRGLEQSLEAHQYLFKNEKVYPNFTLQNRESIKKQIKFETKRLNFLKSKNILCWIGLFPYLNRYWRYYKVRFGGIKVWLGDLAYACHK